MFLLIITKVDILNMCITHTYHIFAITCLTGTNESTAVKLASGVQSLVPS